MELIFSDFDLKNFDQIPHDFFKEMVLKKNGLAIEVQLSDHIHLAWLLLHFLLWGMTKNSIYKKETQNF